MTYNKTLHIYLVITYIVTLSGIGIASKFLSSKFQVPSLGVQVISPGLHTLCFSPKVPRFLSLTHPATLHIIIIIIKVRSYTLQSWPRQSLFRISGHSGIWYLGILVSGTLTLRLSVVIGVPLHEAPRTSSRNSS